jgi:hypothetical protein
MKRGGTLLLGSLGLFAAALGTVLFVPPVRDKFFTTKLWPWPLPWDVTADQIAHLRAIARPGDVVIESNLHGWQWMALCGATTGTTWVHAALVGENGKLLTVHKEAIEADWEIYLEWGSTRMALLRPMYASDAQRNQVLQHARSKLGTIYDASFSDHAGNCNGLVASSLLQAGIHVPSRNCFGKTVYAANCFLEIPGSQLVWES